MPNIFLHLMRQNRMHTMRKPQQFYSPTESNDFECDMLFAMLIAHKSHTSHSHSLDHSALAQTCLFLTLIFLVRFCWKNTHITNDLTQARALINENKNLSFISIQPTSYGTHTHTVQAKT